MVFLQKNKTLMRFSKPILNSYALLDLIKERGLVVHNDEKVLDALTHIGYFRLTGYFKFYQYSDDIFYSGISFSDVMQLYNFDENLRKLTFNALGQIEISLKAMINNHMTEKYGCFRYIDNNNFNITYPINKKIYAKKIESIQFLLQRQSSVFIKDFRKKYIKEKNIPSWMVFEEISMGSVADFYKILNDNDKREIAKKYSTYFGDLEKRIYLCTVLRNICAHHGRLWNKRYVAHMRTRDVIFKDKYMIREIKGTKQVIPNYFNATLVIHYLLCLIHQNNTLIADLKKLLIEYDNKYNTYMGFTDDREHLIN